MRTGLQVIAVCVMALALGCGTDGRSSCTLGNVCEDFTSGDLAAHEKDCKALTGDFAKSACPAVSLVGTCVTAQHQSRRYYAGGANAYTPEAATANCEHEAHGTWTPAK